MVEVVVDSPVAEVEVVVDFLAVAVEEAAGFPAAEAAFREVARQVADLSEAAARQADRVFRAAALPAAVPSAALDRPRAEERAWPQVDLARPVVRANPQEPEADKGCKAARPVVRLNPVVPEEEATSPLKVVPPVARAQALHRRVVAREVHRLLVVVPPAHRLQVARPRAITTITGMTAGAGWPPRAWPQPLL